MNALVPIAAPAMSIPDIERVALAIAKGGLFGSKDPNAVLTLCLLAQAEGQHPAVAFRDYHIIQGKPAKKADAMLRDFITSGGKVEWHTLDDTKADATFSHPSGSARIDWTLERAKKAGITNPMWSKYPRQMLRSRVISEGVRTVFPGATSGLYEVSEVQDIAVENGHAPEAVEVEHQPDPSKRVKLDGPYTSKTALWAAVRAYDREIRSCADSDQLEALLTVPDNVALVEQLERDAPQLLHGGENMPAEFEPLNGLIDRLRSDFANLAEHDGAYRDDAWKTNPARSG